MPRPAQPARRRHSIGCYIFLVILTLIVLAAVGILITWLVTKPKKLHYSVQNASVQKFTLTDDNHLSATFKFTIRSHNPNHRTSIYYDSIEIFVRYKGQTLAFDTMEPFHQPRMNVMHIEKTLVAQNVLVSKPNGVELRAQALLGKIDLEVYVKARVTFKVAMWKSSHRTARFDCPRVMVSLLSEYSNTFTSSCVTNI